MDISELSDLKAESGVIGTLLYHPEYILQTKYLTPSHFWEKDNACVYWAIQELYKDGIMNIDPLNITMKLQSHNGVRKTVERYNLPSIQECVDLYKSVARHSIEEYRMLANRIVTLAFKRSLVLTMNQITNECYNADSGLDKLNSLVYDRINDLTQSYIVSNQNADTLGDTIDDIWKEIEDRRNVDGSCGIPSKYPIFGKYFTYETGELVVIQARMKQGKSAFLLNEVIHKLQNGIPTLVIDTEMKTRLYVERLIAHCTGVDIHRIKNGNYSTEEAEKIEQCKQWIKAAPFQHIYKPDITNEEISALCQMYIYKFGLQFLVFDYIKSNESDTGINANLLGRKTDFLKNEIAGKLDIAVVSACQLNREMAVADSDKINRYLSVGIKWSHKSPEMISRDGIECGNAYAKIYVNRLGQQMLEDDDDDYIDFFFDGDTMDVTEAEKQHDRTSVF